MTQWRLFDGDTTPTVSTMEFHAARQRAPHLEQPGHRPRLLLAAELIRGLHPVSVVDLGCGDGGLLALLAEDPPIRAWGYDFCPANARGWSDRGVSGELRDVFNGHDVPRWGQVAVLTEVLEHLADPPAALAWVARHVRYVVASSPQWETDTAHDECHAWAWDQAGFRGLFEPEFEILSHVAVDWSQVLVGRIRDDVTDTCPVGAS